MHLPSFESFAGQVRATFSLSIGDSSLDLTLVDARRAPPRSIAGLRTEPFSLYFKCGNPVVLPQKLYPFSNSALGKMEIFIVPIGREKDGVVYEAVFN